MSRRSGSLLAWRRWLYVNLHAGAWRRPGLSPLNRLIVLLICLAVLVAIIQSEPEIFKGRERLFRIVEIVFAVIFLAEYCGRVWVEGENPDYGPTLRGRLRYMLTFPGSPACS